MNGLERVTHVTSRELRSQLRPAHAWVREHKNREEHLVEAFDQCVGQFNQLENEEWLDRHSFQNVIYVKNRLRGKSLPTLAQTFQECNKQARRLYRDVLVHTREQMEDGTLTFHTRQVKPRALVVGALFHLYENWVVLNPDFRDLFTPRADGNRIVCALIEVLTLRKKNPLYTEVADKDRLNWIEGQELFARQFREQHGFQ